ncbi:MAG: hypothetical protein WDN24_21785 [Sphingomonas sp.]
MTNPALIAAALLLAGQQAAPADMTVAALLERIEAARGAPAPELSPQIEQLRAELRRVGLEYRAEVDAAKAAGKPPRSCLPPPGAFNFNSNELVAELVKVPEAERAATSIRPAFYALLDRRFACPQGG